MTENQHQVVISLASNTSQTQNMEAARKQLSNLLRDIRFTEALWTEPINSIRQDKYLNQLCQGTTHLDVEALNRRLKSIEQNLGRTHDGSGAVAIDLDILQYDDERHHLRDWERSYMKDLTSRWTS